jgi:hypothetical protein
VTSPIVDRPWLVGGPTGTLHVAYQDLQTAMPTAIWYTRSTDFGETFRPTVLVASSSPDGIESWVGNFVVSPSGGDIYLVYTRRNGAPLGSPDSSGPESVWVAASHDAGATWAQHKVASMPNPASYLYPSIAMDQAGWLHVVFTSRRATDRPVWYAFSKDGVAWTAPAPVRSGLGTYAPWVAGGAAGEAAIQFLASPTPLATTAVEADWYLYAMRVTDAGTGSASFAGGPTTTTPMYHGHQSMPEFNQVRLAADGTMRIAASIYRGSATPGDWTTWYQREQ